METNRFKQIDDYLQERLTNKEAIEFEDEMLLDDELSRQVQLCRELKEAILEQDVALLRQKLSDISKEKPKSMHRPLFFKMAATFTIIFATSVLTWKIYNSPQQLFNNYYTRYELSGVGRDASANSSALQITTLDSEGKFNEVTPLLEQYTNKHPGETAAALMLASVYLENNTALKAENLIKKTINQNQQEIYTETLQWYLCLTFLHEKKYKEALIESSQIASRGGKYAQDAEIIASKLKDYMK